ncbi:alpha/beta hydrolase [Mycolicibacterium sp. 3033]|nr:alpha/beta hydrolase [Mycolicibacterium aurantiacum]
MLTSAGVAVADDGSSSGTGTQASSNAGGDDGATSVKAAAKRERKIGMRQHRDESDKSEPDTTVSDTAEPDRPRPEVTSPDAADSDEAEPEKTPQVEPAAEESATDGPFRKPLPALFSGGKHRAAESDVQSDEAAETVVTPEAEPVSEAEVEPVVAPAPAETVAAPQRRIRPSGFATGIETDLGAPDGAMVMRLAAADAPPVQTQPTLLDVLNTIGKKFYDFYTDTMQFFAGPVRAPFGSSVRVESSTLTIGGHKDVPADWYFPDTDTPAGLIYLQHGFLANASFYSATAAYLAEKTDSIVVVPSLTWNPFDIDDYPLEWPSTGRAIAALFAGDRAALTASAHAAGYDGVLPTRVVLAGHSAGGGLVAMVGRYMVETGNADDLAGLIMFDGVGTLSYMGQDIAAIPTSIPVYNIAAGPSSWNWYGDTNRKLGAVRPGMFTGVTFRDGSHADGMQTTAPIVQYFAYLAMGHSSPLDVLANKVLAAGWINDMLDGTHTDRLYDSDASAWSVVTGWWWDQLTSSSTRRVRTVTL